MEARINKGIVPPNNSLSIVPRGLRFDLIARGKRYRSSFSWGGNDLVVEFTMKQPI
jgi:hypothetical protein